MLQKCHQPHLSSLTPRTVHRTPYTVRYPPHPANPKSRQWSHKLTMPNPAITQKPCKPTTYTPAVTPALHYSPKLLVAAVERETRRLQRVSIVFFGGRAKGCGAVRWSRRCYRLRGRAWCGGGAATTSCHVWDHGAGAYGRGGGRASTVRSGTLSAKQ